MPDRAAVVALDIREHREFDVMGPWGIALGVVVGCGLRFWPRAAASCGVPWSGMALSLLALLLAGAAAWTTPAAPILWTGTWLAGLWWLGTVWTVIAPETMVARETEQREQSIVAVGHWILVTSGLLLLAAADSWIMLVLGVELVRRCTVPRRSDGLSEDQPILDHTGAAAADFDWEQLGSLGLLFAVAGVVLVTGVTSLAEGKAVLQHSYAVDAARPAIGRPAYLLVAAWAGTLIGVCLPVFWTWRWGAGHTLHGDHWLIDHGRQWARQLAAWLAVAQILAGGATGLESTSIAIIWLLTLLTWCVAVRMIGNSQRFDRTLAGIWLFQWGQGLLVCTLGLAWRPRTTSPGAILSSLTLWPGWSLLTVWSLAAGVASLAAVSILIPSNPAAGYWEQFRGLGRSRPWRTWVLLVPLMSLWGLPGLAGFWVRLESGLALLGVHQFRPNTEWGPQPALWQAALLGSILWVAVGSQLLRLTRLMWLESEIGQSVVPVRRWPTVVAVAVTLALILGGLYPVRF